jgi:hypothetical protein
MTATCANALLARQKTVTSTSGDVTVRPGENGKAIVNPVLLLVKKIGVLTLLKTVTHKEGVTETDGTVMAWIWSRGITSVFPAMNKAHHAIIM